MDPTLESSVRGVVFDFGGVLRDPTAAFFDRLSEYDLAREDVLAVFMGPDAVETQMSGQTFGVADMVPTVQAALASTLGTRARSGAEAVLSIYTDPDVSAWNEEMLELAIELRAAGMNIGVLGNGPAEVEEAHFGRLSTSFMDASVLSGRDGVGKPSPQAYELIAERLGVPLEQCFFVDDNAHNVQAAQNLGMPGFLYEGDVRAFSRALHVMGVRW